MMKKITLKGCLLALAVVGFMNAQGQQKTLKLKQVEKDLVYPNTETVVSPSGVVKCATTEYNHILKNKLSSRMTTEQYEQWIAPRVAEIKAARLAAKSSGLMPPPYVIPVVVHVVHNGDALGTGENITDAQVQSQIQVFNEDFGKLAGTPGDGAGVDTGISFCFAQVDPDGNPTNGITHDDLGQASWDSMADIDANLKPATIWDPTKYLNLWTCRFGGGMSSTLGYAQFPTGSGQAGMPTGGCDAAEASSDGVISAYSTFGSRTIYPAGIYAGTSYDKGRTMTHELGHMLGLRHIWGDTGACTNDDFCADTPDATAANFGCATIDSCPSDGLGNDQTENYMDYSDDSCMDMFTQDQADRMIATLENADRRVGLLNSTVCNPVPSIQFTGTACDSTSKDVIEPNGCNAFVDVLIPLEIDIDPLVDATVNFTINGASTAVLGSDYTIQTTSLVFPGSSTADRNYVLRVFNNDFIDADKTVIIDFTVTTGGTAVANSVRNTYTVNIINDDLAPIAVNNVNVYDEDFEDVADWAVYDSDGDGNAWYLQSIGLDGFGGIVGANANSESNGTLLGTGGAYTPDNYMVSGIFTIPAGAAVSVSYVVGSYSGAGSNSEHYSVYFTTITSPSTYADLREFTLENDRTVPGQGTEVRNHDMSAYAGMTGQLVFRHHNTVGVNGLLLFDTINLNAVADTSVQTVVNTGTPDSDALFISGTVYATNSSDGNIMAAISNNNNVDYGCVNTSVSRASGGAQVYQVAGAANFVMDKTFTITPSTVQASGNATVKFYFTETELLAWEAATGNLRSELRVIKDDGTAEFSVATLQTFNTDAGYELSSTLEATFSTGINGTYYFGKEQSLSVSDNQFNVFGVYPNPSNGEVTISLSTNKDVNVSLFDIRGRKVYGNLHSNTSDSFTEKVDFSSMASGVYMLEVQSGAKKAIKKLVIQ
jgi:hypothetical protein